MSYTVKHKTDQLWVHYNPHTQEYCVGGTRLGAATFHKDMGDKFLKDANLGQDWKLESIPSDVTRSTGFREDEKTIHDSLKAPRR